MSASLRNTFLQFYNELVNNNKNFEYTLNCFVEQYTNIYYIGDSQSNTSLGVKDSVPERYETFNIKVKEFEQKLSHWYPLTSTTDFKIDHGKSYFEFFKRIGQMNYYILLDSTKTLVLGTICCIRQTVKNQDVIYICDLKFDHSIRQQGNLKKMLARALLPHYLKTNKFYAISMNSTTKPNDILKMCQHIGLQYNVPIKSNILFLYSLNHEKMEQLHNLVSKYKSKQCNIKPKNIKYISLHGIKDLIVRNSNNQTSCMQLLHMCYNNTNNNTRSYDAPQLGYTHMFCTPKESSLAQKLASIKVYPSSQATIIHSNMDATSWDFIQTCDI